MYRARAEQLKYHDFPIPDLYGEYGYGYVTGTVQYHTTIHTYICTDIIRLRIFSSMPTSICLYLSVVFCRIIYNESPPLPSQASLHQFGLHVWHQSTDLHHFRRPRLSALWWSWFESWLFNKMIPRIKCLRLLRRQRLHFFCWEFWETLNHQSTTRL